MKILHAGAARHLHPWQLCLFACVVLFSQASVAAEAPIQRGYLDKHNNVHIVFSSGIDKQLTRRGRCNRPALAEDGQTMAWITDTSRDSSSVMIYRDGVVRTIKGDPFIRDFWFVKKGNQIAVDSGGAHFAGVETLYDVATLNELEYVDQGNLPIGKCPEWSSVCGGGTR